MVADMTIRCSRGGFGGGFGGGIGGAGFAASSATASLAVASATAASEAASISSLGRLEPTAAGGVPAASASSAGAGSGMDGCSAKPAAWQTHGTHRLGVDVSNGLVSLDPIPIGSHHIRLAAQRAAQQEQHQVEVHVALVRLRANCCEHGANAHHVNRRTRDHGADI